MSIQLTSVTTWAAVLVLTSACAAGSPSGADQHSVAAHTGHATASATPTAAHHHGGPSVSSLGPADVRHTLEQLLGHHTILMIRRMRGSMDGDQGFVAA